MLLTMRGLDEHGKWLPKSKSEFVLNENGQRIRQKNGRWKCRKVNTVDWDDQKYCEVWRHEWELLQNQFCSKPDGLSEWICAPLNGSNPTLPPQFTWVPPSPTWAQRNASNGRLKRKALAKDFSRVQRAVETLRKNGVVEIEDFQIFLTRLLQDSMNLRHNYNLRVRKANRLSRIIAYCENKEQYDTAYRKYQSIQFKGAKKAIIPSVDIGRANSKFRRKFGFRSCEPSA